MGAEPGQRHDDAPPEPVAPPLRVDPRRAAVSHRASNASGPPPAARLYERGSA
ncbi:hypothetical protein SCATT_p10820 (plasmid) [Streptantibioticus cattleyicolor NRRL 8057 = DSM 46488]|uniref:Uncharacterized protein n=1 Tax=Streptantibioticus cattleyicolor (strain ATCC 35852 / DSM 46488 / JCM 4925 / NBRC 14057 / NRRL 8057) TaxID=1003195 RepID=G8XEC1_STREN|nr:hypothetical protein SCATT_p10820 [Streptantibioticus cattleyicolor NRRL 8057 = DSM 46488]